MEIMVTLTDAINDDHVVHVNVDGFDEYALTCGLNHCTADGLEPQTRLYARRFRVFQRVCLRLNQVTLQ